MRTRFISLCIVAASITPAFAASSVTLYRDGALFQHDAVAVKGVITIPLANGLLENTLRIVPEPGTRILTVDTRKIKAASNTDKKIETLTEQRQKLEDRLLALETREAVFTAAAKSQSGKAPRKTKANPDPLQSIRQGTDYAIAQLEAVYTARRKTTQEIRSIDARLATARSGGNSEENSVYITVTPPRGKVTLHYATYERGWLPHYQLHIEGNGTARLQLYAQLTGSRNAQRIRASIGTLAESARAKSVTIDSGRAELADYLLPLKEESYSEGVFGDFSGVITNSSSHYLPTGETDLFRNGTYLGKFRFDGLSSGRINRIVLGR